ncbi:hypothetical protein ES705_27031 [subsurface metagenome]
MVVADPAVPVLSVMVVRNDGTIEKMSLLWE